MKSKLSELSKAEELELWVRKYYRDLFVWAKYKTSNQEIAEDLVQETFLSAWKGFDKFKGDSHPKSWLIRILNNKIADHYRKTYRSPVGLSEKEAIFQTINQFDNSGNWTATGYESIWESPNLMNDEDFVGRLHFCLSELPEKWSRIIADKFLNEKKTAIICQEHQLTTTNYWQVIHRAKLLLKKCLEKYLFD